jgi:hypothetical protein
MALTPQPQTYTPRNESVANRVTGMLQSNSDYLKAAQTQSKQIANQRGMLNSSMAASAGTDAAIKSVLPIAQQEADLASKGNIAQANIASNDREKAMAAAVQMADTYEQSFRQIATDQNMPADARNTYMQHLSKLRDNNLALIEQMYGITLDWGSSGSGGAGAPIIAVPPPPPPPGGPPGPGQGEDPQHGD